MRMLESDHEVGLAADEPRIGGDRQRFSQEIALDLAAFLRAEECELLLGLDTFRHHRYLKAASKPDDGAHDRRRMRMGFEIGNERAIDLDFVEGEGLQIR